MPPPSSPPAGKSKQNKKGKDKGKLKEKPPAQVAESNPEGHGRNKGVDSYQPPDGMVVLDTSQVDDDFDWDSIKDDETKELWMVRVPKGFKTTLLNGLEVQPRLATPGAKLSTFERKRARFDVWSVEHSSNADNPTKEDGQPPRGEELQKLSCLLPRKKKHGKFYLAPKQISQRIIVTHSPSVPNIDNSANPTPSTRDSVPKHLLKHLFLPFGASATTDGSRPSAGPMDVDIPNEFAEPGEADNGVKLPLPVEPVRTKKSKHVKSPQTAGKKRKNAISGESETPTRKPKKLKV